jgi:hypothetical protein
MPKRLDDQTLRELEQGLDDALANSRGSYRDCGQLFRTVRDEKLFREAGYRSFRDYVSERWDMSVKTAYAFIQAADVAKDITIPLPQHHAQLLFRFNRQTRKRLAREIQSLSARDATNRVLQEIGGRPGGRKRKPPEPMTELRRFMSAIQTVIACDVQAVDVAIAALPAKDRRKAKQAIVRARARLQGAWPQGRRTA